MQLVGGQHSVVVKRLNFKKLGSNVIDFKNIISMFQVSEFLKWLVMAKTGLSVCWLKHSVDVRATIG